MTHLRCNALHDLPGVCRHCALRVAHASCAAPPRLPAPLQVSVGAVHPNVVRTLHFVRLDVTGAAARLQHVGLGWRGPSRAVPCLCHGGY